MFGGPASALQRSLSLVALTCAGVTLGVPLADGQRPGRPVVHWNAELRPLVRFVEQERGLRYRGSVPLRIVSTRTFDQTPRIAAPRVLPSPIRRALARAGFVGVASARQGRNPHVAPARYAPASNTIELRDTATGEDRRGALVDALTDALHHQTFDLSLPPSSATEAGAAWQALLVGDRTRVVHAYRRVSGYLRTEVGVDSQPMNGDALIAAANDRFASGWGTAMVQQTFEWGGNAAVNALFLDPPTSRSEVLRRAFGDPVEQALTVPVDDPVVVDVSTPDELGALGWFALSTRSTTFNRAMARTRSLLGEDTRITRATGCFRSTIEVSSPDAWDTGDMQWRGSGPNSVADFDSCRNDAIDFTQSDGIDALRAFTALPLVAMDLARRRNRPVAWGLCVAMVTTAANGPSALLGDIVLEPAQTATGLATCDDRSDFTVAPPTMAPRSA